jgi:hypothetical protein
MCQEGVSETGRDVTVRIMAIIWPCARCLVQQNGSVNDSVKLCCQQSTRRTNVSFDLPYLMAHHRTLNDMNIIAMDSENLYR